MSIRCMVAIVTLVVFMMPRQARAERKSSFLGDLVDGAKQVGSAVKQDVKNYLTYVIRVTVVNKTKSKQHVIIYEPFDPKKLTSVFEADIKPKSKQSFTVEIIPNSARGGMYQIQGGPRAMQFNPKTQDKITYIIN